MNSELMQTTVDQEFAAMTGGLAVFEATTLGFDDPAFSYVQGFNQVESLALDTEASDTEQAAQAEQLTEVVAESNLQTDELSFAALALATYSFEAGQQAHYAAEQTLETQKWLNSPDDSLDEDPVDADNKTLALA